MHLSASCLPACHRHTPVGTAEPSWDRNPSGYSLFPYSWIFLILMEGPLGVCIGMKITMKEGEGEEIALARRRAKGGIYVNYAFL